MIVISVLKNTDKIRECGKIATPLRASKLNSKYPGCFIIIIFLFFYRSIIVA
jgi:hypothetical protein